MHDTPRRLLGAARDKSATQQLDVLLPFALQLLMAYASQHYGEIKNKCVTTCSLQVGDCVTSWELSEDNVKLCETG